MEPNSKGHSCRITRILGECTYMDLSLKTYNTSEEAFSIIWLNMQDFHLRS